MKSQNARMAGLCVKEENRALFGVLNPMFIPPLQLMKDRSYKGRWQEGHSRADCAAATPLSFQSIVEGLTRSNVAKPPMEKIGLIAIC